MEIYILITGVITFIGVVCVIFYLEKASKASAVRFQKEREDVLMQLQSLAAIHGLIETTQGQTNAILSTLQSSLEQSNSLLKTQEANSLKRAEEALAAQNKIYQDIQISLNQKAGDISGRLNTVNETLKAGLDALCKVESENANQVRQALNDSAKQVHALKQSLEESIKF